MLVTDLWANIKSKMGNTLSSWEKIVSQQGPTVAKCWENNFPRITVFSFTQKGKKRKKKKKERKKKTRNIKRFRKYDL